MSDYNFPFTQGSNNTLTKFTYDTQGSFPNLERIQLANSTCNVMISVPNLEQITSNNYFLCANGQWAKADLSELRAANGASLAEIIHDFYVFANSTYAQASDTEIIRAKVENNTATIYKEATSRATIDGATAYNITSLTTSVNGHQANITELFESTDGLKVLWAIQGEIDGVTGGLRFTGAKLANGAGVAYDLIIDANVTINGNVVINGTITTNKVGDNAITDASVGFGPGSATVVVNSQTANDQYLVIGTYHGGDSAPAIEWTAGRLTLSKDGIPDNASISVIRGFFISGIVVSAPGVVIGNYVAATTVSIAKLAAGTAGNHTFTVTTGGLGARTSLLVLRISK